MDSRLRGNDENEIGNDGGEGGNQSFATPSIGRGYKTGTQSVPVEYLYVVGYIFHRSVSMQRLTVTKTKHC
ncbi:hypothetical protein [Endozoicomonas sp. ALC066]|uniref:hypothetical protein n=1 Tax=Endozoicomonas sp. ALC066 TaxID=3403078 RepID=UPI003BB7DE26